MHNIRIPELGTFHIALAAARVYARRLRLSRIIGARAQTALSCAHGGQGVFGTNTGRIRDSTVRIFAGARKRVSTEFGVRTH